MKIAYITGTRADYGLMSETLHELNNDGNIQLEIIVTGMHLMDEFGSSINEIKKDGFKLHVVNQIIEDDTSASMSRFIGNLIVELTSKLLEINPDVVLLLGDRGEMLAGAITSSYLQIPIAHIHGGDISSTVDDNARHAITKLSNIHLAATDKSAKRIIQMGENPDYVFNVGAPGLDSIIKIRNETDSNYLKDKYNINKDFALVLQHPVSLEIEDAGNQMEKTLNAITKTDLQTLVLYPNADSGGREMINVINDFANNKNIDIYKNIPHNDFIGLLSMAKVLIGNSSSGIIESTILKLPTINIGTRQKGREKSENVIDVNYNSDEILEAIKKIDSEDFRNTLKNCKSPYGEGKSSKNIHNILKDVDLNKVLVNKRFFEIM